MHNTNFLRNAIERMWRRTPASSSVPSSGGVIYPEPPFPGRLFEGGLLSVLPNRLLADLEWLWIRMDGNTQG